MQIASLIEEPKFSHVSRNLFMTLASNGRINEASKVIAAFSGKTPFFSCVWLCFSFFFSSASYSGIVQFMSVVVHTICVRTLSDLTNPS
jgi:hypothetical protein